MNKTGSGASFTEADDPCRYRWAQGCDFDSERLHGEWNSQIDYACNHHRVNWLALKTVVGKRLQAEFRKLPGGKRPDWLERQYADGPPVDSQGYGSAGPQTAPAWRGNPDTWR